MKTMWPVRQMLTMRALTVVRPTQAAMKQIGRRKRRGTDGIAQGKTAQSSQSQFCRCIIMSRSLALVRCPWALPLLARVPVCGGPLKLVTVY